MSKIHHKYVGGATTSRPQTWSGLHENDTTQTTLLTQTIYSSDRQKEFWIK